MPNRTQQLLQPTKMTQRRLWTQEEDLIITSLVLKLGTKKWTQISQQMRKAVPRKSRTSKQIRERWHNHLDPSVNKQQWTQEEEAILFNSHREVGSKWKQIAGKLKGRTDNHVKNYFYSTMRRALRRVNKYLGSKNSTTQMRTIRPSILSYLLDLADSNTQIRMLVSVILEMSKNKPTKSSHIFSQQKKGSYLLAIQKLMQVNESYTKKGNRKLQDLEQFKNSQKTIDHIEENVKIQELDQFQVKEGLHFSNIVFQQQQYKQQQPSESWDDEDQQSYNGQHLPELQKPDYQCEFLSKKQQIVQPLTHQYGPSQFLGHKMCDTNNVFGF